MKPFFFLVIFIFIFASNSFSQNGYDVYLHPTGYFSSIAETPDGGFIGCGSISDSIDTYKKFYFSRYDGADNFLWETQIRDTGLSTNLADNVAVDILPNFKNGFFFSGSIGTFGHSTAVVGELDSVGHLISILYLCDVVHCYGNDLRKLADSTFLFQSDEFDHGNHHSSSIWRFNQEYDTINYTGLSFNYGYNFLENKTFNLSFLSARIYFFSIETEKNVFKEKFVKLK